MHQGRADAGHGGADALHAVGKELAGQQRRLLLQALDDRVLVRGGRRHRLDVPAEAAAGARQLRVFFFVVVQLVVAAALRAEQLVVQLLLRGPQHLGRHLHRQRGDAPQTQPAARQAPSRQSAFLADVARGGHSAPAHQQDLQRDQLGRAGQAQEDHAPLQEEAYDGFGQFLIFYFI